MKGVKVLKENPVKIKEKSIVREYAEAIIVALLLAFFIRTFVVQAFKIPSGSMIPTLLIGDHILVNKFGYGVKNPLNGDVWIAAGDPQRHDVIVFQYPQNPSLDFIKRVVGVAGDRVEIVQKKVLVNGEPFSEPNAVNLEEDILPSPRDNMSPITVPPGSVFVMGDNRDNSHDSRFWGFVDLKAIKGKAFILYWSWDRENFTVRWKRLGNIIP
ncbi:MAG TPA: signal peptidase I [Desulfobulbaceae bacterium]|nr:MAG: signal peptidase I [Deltaproteobacteria bacterium RIFOXYD12_FULL_53_23]HCC53895.1 signal peptidase I [Desulfobulbaceae bacterium]